MLKKALVIMLFSFFIPTFPQSALSRLASSSAADIIALLKSPNPVLATVEFTNNSFLSDLEAQTLYQLLSMELEQTGRLVYRDLMVEFSTGKGRFNFSDLSRIRYGLYLALVNSSDGIGLAASLRLMNSSRLLGLVYKTVPIEVDELRALAQLRSSDLAAGFMLQRQESFRLENSIFHFSQNCEQADSTEFFALTPDFLILWQGVTPNQGAGTKIPIKWPFPRTPSVQNEGRINIMSSGSQRILAVGANFSSQSLIFQLTPQGWQQSAALPFIPLYSAKLGDDLFLIGSRFIPGTNRYEGMLHLLNMTSWVPGGADAPKTARKAVDPFFDTAVLYRADSRLNSVFTVGDSYLLAMSDAEWKPLLTSEQRYPTGANLVTVADRWLLTSAAGKNKDTLNLFDAADGGLRFVGSQPMEGMIHSLSEGRLAGQRGVWVLRHLTGQDRHRLMWLDFWRVSVDEK